MTEAVNYIRQSLKDMYPAGEIQSFTRQILECVCGWKPYQFLAFNLRPTESQMEEIVCMTQRLRSHEPIQYVTGITSFCGFPFRVNPSTLIPRPETEEIVELILHDYYGQSVDILDIGTGSGCIAISLARLLPQSRVTALDISSTALDTARENAALNRVDVSFIQSDILSPQIDINRSFDVVVSNPPYIKESERTSMKKNVLDYEPDLALFVPDDDPFVYYRSIAAFAKENIKEGGSIYFEINALHGKAICEVLLKEGNNSVELLQDLAGKDRIIKVKYENT
ncbi:MAG: peptide chain release factor N(5)-glutamine methyltransferase [Tannerellaceae bacterium]|jgi:release factor glutamine methyltransferase|nr:peptide chain release factor N(5)-glutamine methyltransferase [Tannerellaceae bacterium]